MVMFSNSWWDFMGYNGIWQQLMKGSLEVHVKHLKQVLDHDDTQSHAVIYQDWIALNGMMSHRIWYESNGEPAPAITTNHQQTRSPGAMYFSPCLTGNQVGKWLHVFPEGLACTCWCPIDPQSIDGHPTWTHSVLSWMSRSWNTHGYTMVYTIVQEWHDT